LTTPSSWWRVFTRSGKDLAFSLRRANKRLKLTGGEGCVPWRPMEARGFLSRRPQLKRVLDTHS
jgi:hypothetical protein